LNKKVFIVAALSVASFTAQAEVDDVSISLGAGLTQGTGVEIGFDFSEAVTIRGVSYNGKLSRTEALDDISYNMTIETATPGLMVDYYPNIGRSFRFTAGAVDNGNKLSASAAPQGDYGIGDNTYTSSEVGSLKSEITFSGITPYLGLGYQMHATENLSFDFDAGMLITNSPAVTMTADGSAAADATFQEDLEKQRKSLEDSLSSFEYMPMAKVSLTYRF
jgi:hypothetical protein